MISKSYAGAWDIFKPLLELNFGNFEGIKKWLIGVSISNNNGDQTHSFRYNGNQNTALHYVWVGGFIVSGDSYEVGGGWRFFTIHFVRDGSFLKAVCERVDSTHTSVTIYAEGKPQVTFNINHTKEQGDKINGAVIKDFVDKALSGGITFNKGGLTGDNTGEEFGVNVTLTGIGSVKVTVESIAFSNGWIERNKHDLKNAVLRELNIYGIKMGTLDGLNENQTWAKIIETLNSVKSPQPAESIGLQLNISFDKIDDDKDWVEGDQGTAEDGLKDDTGWFVSSIVVRGAELKLETPFVGNGRDDCLPPPPPVGSPTVTGKITELYYDPVTGTWQGKMEVYVWTGVGDPNNIHVDRRYWESLSEEEREEIRRLATEAGGEVIFEENPIEIKIKLCLAPIEGAPSPEYLTEEQLQEILNSIGEVIILHGWTLDGLIKDGYTVEVVGLGIWDYEPYHPYEL